MDFTWSEGLERRQRKKKKEKDDTSDNTLPSINQGSGSPSGTLNASASEPTLSPKQRERNARRKAKCAERVAAFVERQKDLSDLQERRLGFSELVRQVTASSRAKDEAGFIGARGVKGFRYWLTARFGTIVAGWRALDKDKVGRLSFNELLNQCRNYGYHGNLRQLWQQLDHKCRGSITLEDIDPKVGQTVGAFKEALVKEYGDLLRGWQKGVDPDNTGRVGERELSDAVGKLGLDIDGSALFGMLVREGCEALTLPEFDPDSYVKLMRASSATAKADGAEEPSSADAASSQTQALDGSSTSPITCGLQTAASLKQALRTRFGSVRAAWDEAFDINQRGKVTFGGYCDALRRLSLHGNMTGLWKQLDKEGKGYMVFEDLDKKTHAIISEFRSTFEAEYGNMMLAWLKGVDPDYTNSIPEEDFAEACKKVGFSGDPSALFRILVPEPGRSEMQLRDFDKSSFLALLRGDFRLISDADADPPEERRKPMDMTFDERNKSGHAIRVRAGHETAKKEEFRKACRTIMPRLQEDAAEEFEPLCRRVYGSIIGAWRRCLDYDQVGRLSFEQFCAGLRRLGYSKQFLPLWKRLGLDVKGHVTLEDLDPKAHRLVSSFLELLDSNFGDLDQAWKQGFGKDPVQMIDEKEFKEACEKLGYELDPSKLFACLVPAPGKEYLTIWDLDPGCTQRKQQGMVPFILEHKKPPAPLKGEEHEQDPDGSESPTAKRLSELTEAGRAELPQLRHLLRVRYGTTVNAWRNIDAKGKGAIAFGKLRLVLEGVLFNGNVKALWQALAGDRTTTTLQDIDKRAVDMLNEARQFLLGGSPNLVEAWKKYFSELPADPNMENFVEILKQAGFDEEKAEKLFKALCTYDGQSSIGVEDLRPLLWGVDPEDREGTWDGGESGEWGGSALPTGASSPKSLTGKSLTGSQALGASAVELSESVRLQAEHSKQDQIVSSVRGLKKLFIDKYGSLFQAWRLGLDLDGNEVVTKSDFCSAMRETGLRAVQILWDKLDADNDGRLSLAELDPETDEVFTALENALVEHGHLRNGWKQAFDHEEGFCRCEHRKKPEITCCCITPPVNEERFAACWSKLGLPGDGAHAFSLLRGPMAQLCFEDIWPTGYPAAPLGQLKPGTGSPRHSMRASSRSLMSSTA